jgi:hypothetical protein
VGRLTDIYLTITSVLCFVCNTEFSAANYLNSITVPLDDAAAAALPCDKQVLFPFQSGGKLSCDEG